MNKDRPVFIFVHPEFKKKLKIQSAIEGVSMIKFTEKLARDAENNIEKTDQNIKKKGGFKFQF